MSSRKSSPDSHDVNGGRRLVSYGGRPWANYKAATNRDGSRLTQAVAKPGQTRSRCYLLVAASQGAPRGGLGDPVQTFSSEETERSAFRGLRLNDGSAASWAQLAVVDGDKGIQPLCWFGICATPTRRSISAVHQEAVDGRRRIVANFPGPVYDERGS